MNPEGNRTGKYVGNMIRWTRGEVEQGTAAYAADDRDALLWLHGYAMQVCLGRKATLLEKLGEVSPTGEMSETTLYRVWTGQYGASIAAFVATVQELRRRAEAELGTEWIETCVTRAITQVCDLVHGKRCIGLVSGESGRGKTYAVRHWQQANNHGRAIYVYAPDSTEKRPLAMAIAKALNIRDTSRSSEEIIQRLHSELTPRNTLVIDEAQHLLPPGSRQTRAMEFLRTLHDTCRVALILVTTPQFEQQRKTGAVAQYLRQWNRRAKFSLAIPERVSTQEVTEIVERFAAAPEAKLVQLARAVANDAQAGATAHLIELLRDARGAATAAGRADVAAADLAAAIKAEREQTTGLIPEE